MGSGAGWFLPGLPLDRLAHSLGLCGIYLLMDVPFALLAPAINYPVKFLASYFGGRTAIKAAAAQPA